jgi:hypothetical protein
MLFKFKERPLLATILNARLLFSTDNIRRVYFWRVVQSADNHGFLAKTSAWF